ncbi:MAG: chemotaxis protein CheB [Planctomycetes bacterium]|nr:chemotaxis protein CheB [Planctomycetota bacterium]
MAEHDIIVIGASSGGVAALQKVVAELPSDLSAAVLIVLHMDPRSPGLLAGILEHAGRLKCAMAVDGEPIPFGEVRVARPDHHIMVAPDRLVVTQGPKENRSRPSIDILFRSASREFGGRVIGVVLTGNLDDGTAGLWSIKRAGGIAVVQDPKDAEYPDMPTNALHGVEVDHCVPLDGMGALLAKLVEVPAMSEKIPPDEARDVPGVVYVCPDCNGPLREVKIGNEKLVRFQCLVGHAFSMMTLLEGHAEAREAALWTAVVSLEHEAMFADRAAQHAITQNDAEAAAALNAEAVKARAQAQVVRGLLQVNPTGTVADRRR